MDIRQAKGIVSTDHVFCAHAVLILLDHQVQADTTRADADNPSLVHSKRQRVGLQQELCIRCLLVHTKDSATQEDHSARFAPVDKSLNKADQKRKIEFSGEE